MKLDLPIYKQTRPYTCLPACIKIVLSFFSIEVAEDEVALACKTTGAGTLPRNAVAGIRTMGHQALAFEDGTLEFLLESLSRQQPVIVFLRVSDLPYGVAGVHAVVVCGLEEDEVIYVDPELAREVALEAKTFLTAWHSLGGEGLLVWAKSPNSQNA